MIPLNNTMHSFEQRFIELLREDEEKCRSTFRTDKLGNRVVVPFGGTYKAGKNGRGVGIPKGWDAQEDSVGQYHGIPPGKTLKIGTNGSGLVICPSESTFERNGQLMKTKKTKTESRKLSCLDLLRWGKLLEEV